MANVDYDVMEEIKWLNAATLDIQLEEFDMVENKRGFVDFKITEL